MQRPHYYRAVPKMQFWKQITYCLFVAILTTIITRGIPKRASLLNQIQITDKKLDYIFETTIAIQTKTIRHRLTENTKGILQFIDRTFLRAPRWAELQVQLKTRIGIKINSIFYDKLNNNMHIDFGSPQILDRSFTTKILSNSDNFFSSWSISSFEEHKNEFLKELIDIESQNLIQQFKSDSSRINQLQGEYYKKVMMALSSNYNEIDPQILISKLNQYVIQMLGTLIPNNMLEYINSSYYYSKKINQSNTIAISTTNNNHDDTIPKKKKQPKKLWIQKASAIGSSEQDRKRQRIKRQLQL